MGPLLEPDPGIDPTVAGPVVGVLGFRDEGFDDTG